MDVDLFPERAGGSVTLSSVLVKAWTFSRELTCEGAALQLQNLILYMMWKSWSQQQCKHLGKPPRLVHIQIEAAERGALQGRTNVLWPNMAGLRTPFPILAQGMRHIYCFLAAQNAGLRVGAKSLL